MKRHTWSLSLRPLRDHYFKGKEVDRFTKLKTIQMHNEKAHFLFSPAAFARQNLLFSFTS